MLKTSARQMGFGVLGAALVITVMSGPLVYAADPTDTSSAPVMLFAPAPVMTAVQNSGTTGPQVLANPAIGSLSDLKGISGYIDSQDGGDVNNWLTSQGVDPSASGDITDDTIPNGALSQITSKVNDDGTGTVGLSADATGTQIGYMVGDAEGQTGMTWGVKNVAPTSGHENDQLTLAGSDLLKWWNGTTWYADVDIMGAATGLFTCNWTTDGMTCDGSVVSGGNDKTVTALQNQATTAADNMNQNLNADTQSSVALTQMLSDAQDISTQVSSAIPYSFAMPIGNSLTAGNTLTINPSDLVSGSWLKDFTFNNNSSGDLSTMQMSSVVPADVLASLPQLPGYADVAKGQSVADMGSLVLSQAAAKGQFNDSSAKAVISSTNDQIAQINKSMADSDTASNGYNVVFRPLDQASEDTITKNTPALVSSLMAGGWSQQIANAVTADVTVDSTIDAGKITTLNPTGVTYGAAAGNPGADQPPTAAAPPANNPDASSKAPVFTQPQDGHFYGTTQVTQIKGTAEAGSTVTVALSDGTTACTATTDDTGVWSCDYAVTEAGDGTLTATAVDSQGQTLGNSSVSFTVEEVAPPTVDVANAQTISGTGEPATALAVFDLAGNVLGNGIISADGKWAITTPADAKTGEIAAVVMRPDGAFSPLTLQQLVMEVPQAPTANAPSGQTLTGTLPGTVTDGTKVVVTYPRAQDTNTVEVNPAADGTWSFTLPDDFVAGTVTVVAKDPAGNVSGPANVTVTGPPPGLGSAPSSTASNTSGSDSTGSSTDSSTADTQSTPAGTPDTQTTPAGTPDTQTTPAGTPDTQTTPAGTQSTPSSAASTPTGAASTPTGAASTPTGAVSTPGDSAPAAPTGTTTTATSPSAPTSTAGTLPSPSTQTTANNPSSTASTPGSTTPTVLPTGTAPTTAETGNAANPTPSSTATGSTTSTATSTATGSTQPASVYYVVQTTVDGQAAGEGTNVVTFAAGKSQTDPISGVRADFTADSPGMLAQSYCVTDASGTCTVGVQSPTAGPVTVHAFVNGVEVDNDLGVYTSPVTVNFVDAAPQTPSATPMTPNGPLVMMNVPVVVPGTVVTLSGANWAPGETVVITIQSTPITLPPLTANADGTLSAVQVPVPADFELGTHTLTAVGSVSGAYSTTFTAASSSSGLTALTGGTVAGGSGIAWALAIMAIGFGAFLLVSRRQKA